MLMVIEKILINNNLIISLKNLQSKGGIIDILILIRPFPNTLIMFGPLKSKFYKLKTCFKREIINYKD
jgi:hypothetical protein